MSTPVLRPCTVSYSPLNSGEVQTGEISHVRGGGRRWSQASGHQPPPVPGGTPVPGSGGGVMQLMSGPGRLNSILQHVQMTSGLEVLFYDAIAPGSGGPYRLSGEFIIGRIPPTYEGGALGSGSPGALANGGLIYSDMPFLSGLAVAVRSGQPGWTVGWTAAVGNLNP